MVVRTAVKFVISPTGGCHIFLVGHIIGGATLEIKMAILLGFVFHNLTITVYFLEC